MFRINFKTFWFIIYTKKIYMIKNLKMENIFIYSKNLR